MTATRGTEARIALASVLVAEVSKFYSLTAGRVRRQEARHWVGRRLTFVLAGKIPCAGKTGATCPKGYVCVDDPSDSCDPAKGGKDCGGICVGGIVS